MDLRRLLRPAVMVIGFLSSTMGTLGSFLLVERLGGEIKALTDQKNGAVREAERLGALAGQYFMANQQGDLIYALGLQETARKDLILLLLQGNLLDRAEPVRNIIGAMAIARLLDYGPTYGAYQKLNDEARRSFAWQPYQAVKAREREIVERAQARVAELQQGLGPLQERITHAEAELSRRRTFIITFSFAGAFLMLLANLLEHRSRPA